MTKRCLSDQIENDHPHERPEQDAHDTKRPRAAAKGEPIRGNAEHEQQDLPDQGAVYDEKRQMGFRRHPRRIGHAAPQLRARIPSSDALFDDQHADAAGRHRHGDATGIDAKALAEHVAQRLRAFAREHERGRRAVGIADDEDDARGS